MHCNRRQLLLPSIALVVASASAQPVGQTCELISPPPPFADNGFTGQSGHVFDYSADAGGTPGSYFLQLMVRNRGTTPLTFNWDNADFFRRGVPSGVEARSACRSDGNTPNVSHGSIRYGPNVQFEGPDAKFYQLQQPALARTLIQPIQPAPLPAVDRVGFSVRWVAILESGEQYVVDFVVGFTSYDASTLGYEFLNAGAPVEIEWPIMLSSTVLNLARLQNRNPVVRNNRLALPAGKTVVPIKLNVKGPVSRESTAMSVFTPDGVLLYRDVLTGLSAVNLR